MLEFKKSGPWIRIGNRSLAQKRFDAVCKKSDGLRKLQTARDAYADEVKAMYRLKTARGETLVEIGHYVLHLCTWLTRWEDYFEERTETLFDEVPAKPEIHQHRCTSCRPMHDWDCRDKDCKHPGKAKCWMAAALAGEVRD